MVIPTLKTCHFEASEDIDAKHFEDSVLIFQFLNDKVLFDIIVNFINQKLKSKHTSLKKYTN